MQKKNKHQLFFPMPKIFVCVQLQVSHVMPYINWNITRMDGGGFWESMKQHPKCCFIYSRMLCFEILEELEKYDLFFNFLNEIKYFI